MNFLLNDEQRQLFDAVLDFAVTEADRGARRDAFEGDQQALEDLWRRSCDLGLAGIVVPQRHGGLGLTMVELALACEALGYAGAPGPALFHGLAALAIALGADEETQARILPALATGARTATFAWGEGENRWLPHQLGASLSGTGLTATKHHVVCGQLADVFVVQLGDGRLVLIEDAAEIAPQNSADPARPLSKVTFGQSPALPLNAFDGDLGTHIRDGASVLLSADSYGVARRCLDMTMDYSKVRKQFGAQIGSFQAVKHQLADLAADVEAARGLYWYAALANATQSEDAARIAVLAKSHICDLATHVAREAAKLHGGIGFTWEYDLHIWLRRAMVNSAIGGTGHEMRRRYAELMGWATRPRLPV